MLDICVNNRLGGYDTDREERESSDRDVSFEHNALSTPTTPSHQSDVDISSSTCRSRCHTMTAGVLPSKNTMKLKDDEDDIEDPEFAAVYDDFNFERIKRMSREEVNCEMLVTQKTNLHLNEKVDNLKTENFRLRTLLGQHGIDYSELLGSANANFSFKLPHNSSSSSSSQNPSRSSADTYDEPEFVSTADYSNGILKN